MYICYEMSLTSDESLLFHYGWDHFWCDFVNAKNIAVREFIRGPFAKPKLVCSIPFVTRCQKDGTPFEIREGIPDCWADYLTRKHLQNYELMHKENVDVVPQLRKYRLFLGQGIPDPWTAYLYNPEILPHPKHRKHSKNKKEERCLCCEREYLFECPDNCASNGNRCSCKDCHGKNSSDSTDNCRCSEIFHNWVLRNTRRRGRRGSLGDCLSSPSGSHSETDDDGGHLKGRNQLIAFCDCSGNDMSELGGGDHEPNEKTLKFNFKNGFFSKHHPKVYSCPCVKHFCLRKQLESTGERKVSKEIQTEIPTIKSSKTVQTEKPERKAQPKCTCRSKCFPCSVLSRVKTDCPGVHSISNFCCSPIYTRRPTFVCPYALANHLNIEKHNNETGAIQKRLKKKKQVKEKDSDEGSNADIKFAEARVGRESLAPKSKTKEDFRETMESLDHLKCHKNVYYSQTPSTTLDHIKFLANYKLKGYLHQEESFPVVPSNKLLNKSSILGLKYKTFSGNSSMNNLKQEESPMEKFKPFSSYRYSESAFHDSKVNIRHRNFSNNRFTYCDQATMTSLDGIENVLITKENVDKEIIDNDEPKVYGFLRNHEVTKALGKRRKLLRNRKRRRKLVASILVHPDSLTKPSKHTLNYKNKVQVEGFPQGSSHLKRYLTQNFTSASDHLSAEVSHLKSTGTMFNSKCK